MHNMHNFSKILTLMYEEAKKKNAPVFKFEKSARDTPFKALLSVILSSRTKDATTLRVSKLLFSRIKDVKDLQKLKEKELEKILYGVGFYKIKSKYLKKLAQILIKEYDGKVPSSLETLLKLPGVGRKTANIVLSIAFGKNTLGVDVHVHRLSNRLGWVKTKNAEKTEYALVKIVPPELIRKLNKTLVAYGQTICTPINPDCTNCKLNKICPKIGVKLKKS